MPETDCPSTGRAAATAAVAGEGSPDQAKLRANSASMAARPLSLRKRVPVLERTMDYGPTGVFAHDHEVDVLWALVLKRGLDVGVELDRAQVDVLVEGEAGL